MTQTGRLKGRTALITGASGGIGYDLVQLFAVDGCDLVLVARKEQELQKLAEELTQKFKIKVKVIAKDLAVATAPQEIFEAVRTEGLHIDILVNNAGFATYGLFMDIDLATELQLMQLNMITLTHLTKLFLKPMVENRWGYILNISSTAAFQPGPLMAVYYASKAYVLSFSEALANELSGWGVSVTALCPGPTRTGFQERAAMQKSKLVSGVIMDSKSVAHTGYEGMLQKKHVVIPGAKNKFLAGAVKFFPRDMIVQMVRKTQRSE